MTQPGVGVFRRWAVVAVVGAVAMAVEPPYASAHTSLKEASPPASSSVASPASIVLTYADPVRLPRVVLTDASGGQHGQGKAHSIDNKVTLPVAGPLKAGVYTVGWRVVSPDGHPISGEYNFTVTGGSGGGQAAQPVQAPVSSSGGSTSSAGWLWLGLIALVIGGAAGGVAFWRRRKTTTA